MAIHPPDISFVTSVYNKADILPAAIKALSRQFLSAPVDYIFVEDCSRDDSLSVLYEQSQCLERVSILKNERNLGPALSLNRGANHAKGRYLCLVDADELIVPDAVSIMLDLLQQHDAPLAHGQKIKTTQPADQLTLCALDQDFTYEVLDNPFIEVLKRRGAERIGSMTWLVEKTLFSQAGGCDPRLFVQDESLRLRLTHRARRMINFKSPMMYAPPARYQISRNDRQQHHDQFFCCYDFWCENKELPQSAQAILVRQSVSMAWKATRDGVLGAGLFKVLLSYLGAKTGFLKPQEKTLEYLAGFFKKIPDIRRPDIHEYPEN